MVQKSNLVALRRDPEMADPALTLVESMTDGIFDAIAVLGMVDYSQFTIRSPICRRNVFEDLSWRASAVRCAWGRADLSYRPGSVGLAGVQEQGAGTSGFPRNLGRPAVSISLSTGLWGKCQTQSSPAPSRRRTWQDTRRQAQGVVTVMRRKRSVTGRAVGNRSTS